jgi:molybdate transport system ATP-binding protein
MHLYYRENVPCLKVVQSGFFDSVGLYKQCTAQQTEKALSMMRELGIAHLANKPFLKVSAGEQRMLLFARALIKNPQLLILDEPFHGMDLANKKRCLKMIAAFAAQTDKSLIFVTHYRNEIPACVNRVYELQPPVLTKKSI